MAKKIIGYILVLVGLASITLSLGLFDIGFPLSDAIKPIYLTIAGLVITIIGAFLGFGTGKGSHGSQQEEEVPIYSGEGRKRKIVGYRRQK